MKRDYVLKPNVISYTAAISACGKVTHAPTSQQCFSMCFSTKLRIHDELVTAIA
jgi:hypothetical protein